MASSGGAEPSRVFGRFETSRPNELWTGDALHGPVVADRKAILFAFIDDYSRLLAGYRWGYSEDVVRLEAALRSGWLLGGCPERSWSTGARRSCRASCCGRAPPWGCA